MPGETLARSERVAMTPTVQPAAAGTQEYRDLGRTSGGLVRVIGREDIRSIRRNGCDRYQTGPVCFSPGP